MAGFRGFPLLFLLPLILGCFLSFSSAGALNRKRRKSDFVNADVIDLVTEGPEPGIFYRELLEDADTQFPESDGTGYRGIFGKEFVTKIPPFGPKYRGLEEETESDEEMSESRAQYRGLRDKKDFATEFSESAGTRFRSLSEETDSVTAPSLTEGSFRGLSEGKDVVTEIPYYESNYRALPQENEFVSQAEDEKLGFRLKFMDEMKDFLENFDQKYVDKMSCDELKERMSRIVEFMRQWLGFIK